LDSGLLIHVYGIDDAYDDGNDATVRDPQSLAGAVAFTVDQDSVPNAGVAVVPRQEVAAFILFQVQRLDDQQAPVLEVGMANRGHDRADNFSNHHVTA
jgi:hypothetical protein